MIDGKVRLTLFALLLLALAELIAVVGFMAVFAVFVGCGLGAIGKPVSSSFFETIEQYPEIYRMVDLLDSRLGSWGFRFNEVEHGLFGCTFSQSWDSSLIAWISFIPFILFFSIPGIAISSLILILAKVLQRSR